MKHILRHAILAWLEYPESTLLDLPLILVDKEFRKKVLKKVTNTQVRDFCLTEFERYSAYLRSEGISPIQNKIGQFIISPLIRNIIGQSKSTIDFRKIMDEGYIFIANLSKGKIGEDNCVLLGAMIVTKIELSALSPGDIPEFKRRSFYLYVDEIHNFLTLSFADIPSEARKCGFYLILTYQYIEQLDKEIRSAIFGNVGTLITFRIGAGDTQFLKNEFSPVFDETDLVNLANYHIYLRLMINGVTYRPFSAITLPPPEVKTSHKTKAIGSSRMRFARPRAEVEREIMARKGLGGKVFASSDEDFLEDFYRLIQARLPPAKSEDYRISGVDGCRLKERMACKAKTLYFSPSLISSR